MVLVLMIVRERDICPLLRAAGVDDANIPQPTCDRRARAMVREPAYPVAIGDRWR